MINYVLNTKTGSLGMVRTESSNLEYSSRFCSLWTGSGWKGLTAAWRTEKILTEFSRFLFAPSSTREPVNSFARNFQGGKLCKSSGQSEVLYHVYGSSKWISYKQDNSRNICSRIYGLIYFFCSLHASIRTSLILHWILLGQLNFLNVT